MALFRSGHCFWCCFEGIGIPTASEGLVEGNEIYEDNALALHQLIFGGEEIPLGLQGVQESFQSAGVPFVGEEDGALVGRYGFFQGATEYLFFVEGDEGILHFGKGQHDGLLIADGGFFLARILHVDVGTNTAALEQGPIDAGADAAQNTASFEEVT